jgi:hypothetical protein
MQLAFYVSHILMPLVDGTLAALSHSAWQQARRAESRCVCPTES